MKLNELVLRCYAEKEDDGEWFAICLDLNLYARGDSFDEARTKLNRLTSCYLKEAVEKDAKYIGDLIPRRAPLSFWLRYALIRGMNIIHHQFNSKQDFKMPLPLIPAF